ncbi:MAG: hypothetical protein M3159_09705 [Actinomycetota bacterium]|nr:hypothetical protein [Actinomycetota bacterium]
MADDNDDDTPDEGREERLQRNTSADPGSKSQEDEHNPMHPDSWSGGSIVEEAKKIARGELPRDQEGGGPNTPEPGRPATPPEVSRPWSPEPTEADATGSAEGVDYSGRPRPRPVQEDEARQAPPTIREDNDSDDADRPGVTQRA